MLQPREFYKEELSGFFFWWGGWWGRKQPNTSLTGSPLTQLQPHPRPLSEWRGEWILLVGWERVVRGDRGNCILKLRKRPSRLEKGVSSLWREPFFTPTKRPLHLQIMVFTPLSIRRGAGGEAVVGLGERLSFICKSNCFIYSLCLFNKNGG